jgi:DNA-binding PadR family transcriptional regulator
MNEIEKRSLSGYDIITLVFDKFHFLVSSGTVYATLYSLERKGLIEGTLSKKKITYHLTEKGKFTIHTIMSEPHIQYCVRTLSNSFNNKHA